MTGNTEVTGRYVVGFLDVAEQINPVFEQHMQEVLAENGITDPTPTEWYPASSFWAATHDAVEKIGSQTVLQAGVEMGRAVPWGGDVESPIAAIERAVEENQAAYRNASEEYPAGQWHVRDHEANTVVVGVGEDVPYAPAIAKGAVKGAVEQADTVDSVTLEDAQAKSNEHEAVRVRW